MRFSFVGPRISALTVVLPKNEQSFIEDMQHYEFPESRSLKLMEVMGYDKHRLVEAGVCSSDLAIHGLKTMLSERDFHPSEIDALIVVTQTPDYFIPPTSSVLHDAIGLSQEALCVDLVQGCAGFPLGLIQSFLLLSQPHINKVILVNVDVLSRKVSKKDRNSFPLIGDAAAITLLERGGDQQIWANVRTDGSRREALMIPAGGMKMPCDPSTSIMKNSGDGNFRSEENLVMNGSAVFNFVQTEVPELIEDLFAYSGRSDEDIYSYVFHQPNRFMLEKLADRLGVSRLKMPMNVVERYGNSSGVTIPVALASNFGSELEGSHQTFCLAGFGVGLTWSSMLVSIGNLTSCRTVEF